MQAQELLSEYRWLVLVFCFYAYYVWSQVLRPYFLPTPAANPYWTVLSSWWALNVSHRRETNQIVDLARVFGIPTEMLAENDLHVVAGIAAALFGHARKKLVSARPVGVSSLES